MLWQTSLIDSKNPRVNRLGATQISPVPSDDVHSSDLVPEIGITATPVSNPESPSASFGKSRSAAALIAIGLPCAESSA